MFRDYVYIPLGGSRRGRWITLRNTLTVFALSGLWHGANWTYVCWGLYHAVLFVPIILVSKSRKFADEPQLCIADVCRMLLTFLLVVFGWIIFRAPSMSQAVDYIVHLAASMADSPLTIMHGKAALLYSAVIVAAEWMQRRHPHALYFAGWMGAAGAKTTVARYAVYLLIATAIILLRGEAQTFIYFQF